MKSPKLFLICLCLFIASTAGAFAADQREAIIVDDQHFSTVLGEIRHYRVFLPPAYFDQPGKKYPVIYFFHGWSQRYFGSSDRYADFDKGDENKGDNIAHFVASHDVIVVKADGYNRSPDEKYYVRPYNIGPVETYRQFPLYFPELVQHIDTRYHTLADREHRAVAGLSMGGFMTFWIAGKYPHLVSGAGNFCGSAEFVVGPKDFPVEYRHLDMAGNYAGVRLMLHYGDKDFIRGYHQDLNRVWPQLMDNYQWRIYDAAHSTCGMGDLFGFLLNTFDNPLPRPARWNHIDVYPDFSVWDYQVRSDRDVTGFTILENVDKTGFRLSVRDFLPDGELQPHVNLSVTTPALYDKNAPYLIRDIDAATSRVSAQTVISDDQGRLVISMNGGRHEIGINKKGDKPNLGIASFEIQNMNWATASKDVSLSVTLYNKGLSQANRVTARLSATKDNVIINQAVASFANISPDAILAAQTPFRFRVTSDSIEVVRLKLTIADDRKNEWVDFLEIPVRRETPEIDFEIADGRTLTVARGGNDTETLLLGRGNGDGVANPGEFVVLLAKDQNKFWRLRLHTPDPYINPSGIHLRKSDSWGEFDHVGGSAKYDIPLVASGCPENHTVVFFAEYWLPDYPLHIIKQGVVKMVVKGRDKTSPVIRWVRAPGDNTLQVKLDDGGEVQTAKAKLISADDPARLFEVELHDDGANGDAVKGDRVFSRKIPDQKFGAYRAVIEVTDAFGNKTTEEAHRQFLFY